jgi:hypothetical protein
MLFLIYTGHLHRVSEISDLETHYELADWLPAGKHQIQYFSQVGAAGTFATLPAKAEEMYDEDQFCTSAFETIVVDSQ